jgi:hypothetical protein
MITVPMSAFAIADIGYLGAKVRRRLWPSFLTDSAYWTEVPHAKEIAFFVM